MNNNYIRANSDWKDRLSAYSYLERHIYFNTTPEQTTSQRTTLFLVHSPCPYMTYEFDWPLKQNKTNKQINIQKYRHKTQQNKNNNHKQRPPQKKNQQQKTNKHTQNPQQQQPPPEQTNKQTTTTKTVVIQYLAYLCW